MRSSRNSLRGAALGAAAGAALLLTSGPAGDSTNTTMVATVTEPVRAIDPYAPCLCPICMQIREATDWAIPASAPTSVGTV